MVYQVTFVIQGSFTRRSSEVKSPELELHPGDIITWNAVKRTFDVGGPRRPLLRGPIVLVARPNTKSGHAAPGEMTVLQGPGTFEEARTIVYAMIASKPKYLVDETVERDGAAASWEVLKRSS